MTGDPLRLTVRRLADALCAHGGPEFAAGAYVSLEGSDEELKAFLVSDGLWGGAGSLADQAGLTGLRDDNTRAIERALADLGEEQMRAGIVNVRTEAWVNAFRRWQRDNL